MPDREKAIRILEGNYKSFVLRHNGELLTVNELIALLKAQEPVEPIFDYDGKDVWRCGNCHSNIFHPSRTDADENEKNYRRFCFHCGREVKWK